MDEWKRFANAAVQEELIAQDRGASREVPLTDRQASTEVAPQARGHREGRARAARDPGALEAGRRGAARAGAGAVAPLPPGRRSDPGQGARVLRAARRGAQRQPQAQAGAHRARRGARRLDRLDQDRRRAEEAPGRVAGDRARAAAGHAGRRGSASATRATRSSRAATPTSRERKETWSANLAKKEALCARAEELATSTRVGAGPRPRSAACRPSGRRSARCAAPSPRRSGSASAPRATRSSIATSGATRSSSKPSRPIARRSSPSSRRWQREPRPRSATLAPTGDAASPGAPTSRRTCSSACARCARAGTRRRRSCATAPIR